MVRWSVILLNFFIAVGQLNSLNLTAKTVISKMENLTRGQSAVAQYKMSVKKSRIKRTMSFESWYDSVGEKSFVRILSPRKDRGITFLKLDKNLWQYMPSINREIKIESSLMSDSWMGSDFSNDDLVQESSSEKDYTHKYIESENEQNFRIQMTPLASSAIVWSKVIVEVEKITFIPIRQEFYDHRSRLKKIMTFSEVKKFGKRKIPAKMVMQTLKKGKPVSTTELLIERMQFNQRISPKVFSKGNLRR